MSKSTKKHGQVTFHAHPSIEAHPQPTEHMLQEWRFLNAVSQRLYNGRHYFNLSHAERVALLKEEKEVAIPLS